MFFITKRDNTLLCSNSTKSNIMITVFGFTFCILLHCRSAHFAYLLTNTSFVFFFHNYKSRYFGECQRGIWGLWYSKVERQTGRHGCRWSVCESRKERLNLGKKGGVSALLRQHSPHLVDFHCLPHRLELALVEVQKS